MQYTTPATLKLALSKIDYEQLIGDQGVFDDAVSERINQDAVELIHSKLGGVYAIPLRFRAPAQSDAVPLRIRAITHDLMIYYAWKRRDAARVPEALETLYARTITDLDNLRKGNDVLLDVVRLADLTDNTGIGSDNYLYDAPAQVFDKLNF